MKVVLEKTPRWPLRRNDLRLYGAVGWAERQVMAVEPEELRAAHECAAKWAEGQVMAAAWTPPGRRRRVRRSGR